MRRIWKEIMARRERGEDLCLVLIVDGDGSAPRTTGSMMLVGPEGRIAGTVGGGAVELYSERLAGKAIAGRQSFVHAYRLHPNGKEDIGMICGGNVDILFQYIAASEPAWDEVGTAVLSMLDRQEGGEILFDADGGLPCVARPSGDPAAGTRPERVLYSLPVETAENAFLFGGGHITKALVPILKSVGFRVTVVDNRPDYATKERFPAADEVICCPFQELSSRIEFGPEDYAAVMTSGHLHDYEVLLWLLGGRGGAYIGSIGSKRKIAAINERLLSAGIPEERVSFVHAPIGTAIRAVTPEEIAVSIAGEMILVRAEHRDQAGKEADHGCPMHRGE